MRIFIPDTELKDLSLKEMLLKYQQLTIRASFTNTSDEVVSYINDELVMLDNIISYCNNRNRF